LKFCIALEILPVPFQSLVSAFKEKEIAFLYIKTWQLLEQTFILIYILYFISNTYANPLWVLFEVVVSSSSFGAQSEIENKRKVNLKIQLHAEETQRDAAPFHFHRKRAFKSRITWTTVLTVEKLHSLQRISCFRVSSRLKRLEVWNLEMLYTLQSALKGKPQAPSWDPKIQQISEQSSLYPRISRF
jgi:hypothetical protein